MELPPVNQEVVVWHRERDKRDPGPCKDEDQSTGHKAGQSGEADAPCQASIPLLLPQPWA